MPAAWDYILRAGTPLAPICPTCAALIPPGNTAAGISYRDTHTRHHHSQETT